MPDSVDLKWDLEEFRNLCQQQGLEVPEDYINSINRKLEFASYHAQKCNEVMEELFEGNEVDFQRKEWSEAEFEYEGHFLAFAHSLHSLGDVFAQILNLVLLSPALKEENVSLKPVRNTLDQRGGKQAWVNHIDDLINSNEYDYLNALENIIKHRRLIKKFYRTEVGEKTDNKTGLKFKEFTYRNKQYPEVWLDDLLETYPSELRSRIISMGIALNEQLR